MQPINKHRGQKPPEAETSGASKTLPSIGCYVKDEYAQEFQVQSGMGVVPDNLGKRRSRWPYVVIFGLIALVSLFFGFQRHGSADNEFLRQVQMLGERAFAVVKFPIDQVHIVGHEKTSEQDIVSSLGAVWDRSLISLNTAEAQKNIERLPWVKQAIVERVFPHGLNVYVTERVAIGRWVTLGGRYVFDDEGVVIEQISAGQHMDLPIYEGARAPDMAKKLQLALKKFDDLSSFFVRYRRVEGRRWTLVLKDGMEVLLPEKHMMRGLSRLRALQVQHNILLRRLVAIDLRLDDRITLRPKSGQKVKVLSPFKDLETKGRIESDSLFSDEVGALNVGTPAEGI